ncbi:MAG: phosphotransferase family protein [Acidimicrobiales bacterium]
MAPEAPAGIDIPAVTAWFEANIAGAAGPLRFQLLEGGHSNFTYRVSDAGGRDWVLRRPPLGELLPSAHDMSREHRIIKALGGTGVPAPAAIGFCEDPAVTGAWFYVMSYVPGWVCHDEPDVTAHYDEAQRRRMSETLVDGLLALHRVDPDAVGLGDLSKREGYVLRQLKRWAQQYEASKGELEAVPRLAGLLSAKAPAEQRVTVVHGDYRLGNAIVGFDGAVAAIVDWEISALGDPLADLAYLVATWREPGDPIRTIATGPSALPGFASRRELVERYGQATELDVSGFEFYLAFAYWKIACIVQGVWARYDAGQKPPDDVDLADMLASVRLLAERADELATAL